jgi:UDP-N-acetylmuramoylalanine--D-glutamate ligase
VVAELSSFQLEETKKFRPKVAAILNITADHLDRHGNFANYAAAKEKIFANQDGNDFTILNNNDAYTRRLAEKTRGRVYQFNAGGRLTEGAYTREGHLEISLKGRPSISLCSVKELSLPGRHNVENALAAALMAHLIGTPPKAIVRALKSFPGVEHRCEVVGEVLGRKFINDSKGTNPEAAVVALRAVSGPIVLIAGGRAKGADFSEFALAVKEKVKSVVLLGEAAPDIKRVLMNIGYDAIFEVSSLKEAVWQAYGLAEKGDSILLSPACASWDMFSSFEERGKTFKEAVVQLRREIYERKP